jgi:hypothetical protein
MPPPLSLLAPSLCLASPPTRFLFPCLRPNHVQFESTALLGGDGFPLLHTAAVCDTHGRITAGPLVSAPRCQCSVEEVQPSVRPTFSPTRFTA